MGPDSIYSPEGAFAAVMLVLAATLVAAVVYLVVFTGATIPPT